MFVKMGTGSGGEAAAITGGLSLRAVSPGHPFPVQAGQHNLPMGCQEQPAPSSAVVVWGQHMGTSPWGVEAPPCAPPHQWVRHWGVGSEGAT